MNHFKATVKYIAIAAAIICAADVALLATFNHWRPPIEHADAIIILGAAINTPALYNRTQEGLRLYQDGKADTLILSGGKIADSDISEAEYMEKVIIGNTAEPVRYVLEDQSHNTYENIRNSKAMLGEGDDTVIIVSDEFHLARAVLLAKRAGIEKVYWSAPVAGYYRAPELRFYYFREFVALINYIPKFIFG